MAIRLFNNTGLKGQVAITGSFNVENFFDYIGIYAGVGTSGTLLQSFNGKDAIGFIGTRSQIITVKYRGNWTFNLTGFALHVNFLGSCTNVLCTAFPAGNTVVVPSKAICPNTATLLTSVITYSNIGICYLWFSSTNSRLDPHSAISGAINSVYVTPNLTASKWHSVAATCTNGSAPATNYAVAQVSVVTTATNSVPYFEGFKGAGSLNYQLPRSSRQQSSIAGCKTTLLVGTNKLSRSGAAFAYFQGSNTCFPDTSGACLYSNSVQLCSGVTAVGLYGCIGSASLLVNVNPLTIISLAGNRTVCANVLASVVVSGAISYQWMSGFYHLQDFNYNAACAKSNNCTTVDTISTGCSVTYFFALIVDCLVGIKLQNTLLTRALVYPKPNASNFIVELPNRLNKEIKVVEVTGRFLSVKSGSTDSLQSTLNGLLNAMYCGRIIKNKGVEKKRVVKE